jgi:N-acetylmuramoyl-L-alanine amidase
MVAPARTAPRKVVATRVQSGSPDPVMKLSAAVPPEQVPSEMPVVATVSPTEQTSPVKMTEAVERIASPSPAPEARPLRRDMDGDVKCVAQAVFHEARGESVQGQRAVADVVMNRARSGRWGGSACAVVNAPSQFSNRWSWRAPQIGVEAWDRAVSIARDAVAGAIGVSSRLMNFRAARLGGGVRALRIGNHVFW